MTSYCGFNKTVESFWSRAIANITHAVAQSGRLPNMIPCIHVRTCKSVYSEDCSSHNLKHQVFLPWQGRTLLVRLSFCTGHYHSKICEPLPRPLLRSARIFSLDADAQSKHVHCNGINNNSSRLGWLQASSSIH